MIKEQVTFPHNKKILNLEYSDCDDFCSIPASKTRQVYGVCLYDKKLVLVHNGKKDTWGLVGGTIEKSEKFEQTLFREIKEESNMKVLEYWPIGYQYIVEEDNYQLRYACIVEPFGSFELDPAGTIDKIALINPSHYKKYFDWQKIGDQIISRGLELIYSQR